LNNAVNTQRVEPASQRSILASQLKALPPEEASALLERTQPGQAAEALQDLNPAMAAAILAELDKGARSLITSSAPPEIAEQWKRNASYPKGTIGRLMDAPLAIFSPDMTVGESIEALKPIVRTAFVTYIYVVDAERRLEGLVTMRDLLFNPHEAKLSEVMLRHPFELKPDQPVPDAMKLTVNRHYPQYPVVDYDGKLVGLVRGATLFESQAFEVTAQAGSMVGVDKEERIATPIGQSFKFRNPWLLSNLLTAFAAGGVVAVFQGTLDKFIILAAFLPVLAGQSGNTGCQALAVTIRGITLGDIKPGGGSKLVSKEALLGIANGLVTGLLCGIAMYLLAVSQGSPHALMLGIVVTLALMLSCAISGVSGALVPLALKRMGADPATASSIFVTTATDIASMGLLLGLAALMIRA
jgi:magnesium transporter